MSYDSIQSNLCKINIVLNQWEDEEEADEKKKTMVESHNEQFPFFALFELHRITTI